MISGAPPSELVEEGEPPTEDGFASTGDVGIEASVLGASQRIGQTVVVEYTPSNMNSPDNLGGT
jgi:hypothetical protein